MRYRITFFWSVMLTLLCSGSSFANTSQGHYRWRNDDGSETSATWRKEQNTADTLGTKKIIRLRVELYDGYNNSNSTTQLFYSTDNSTYIPITTDGATNHWKLADSPYITDLETTTDQLTNIAFSTFEAGNMVEATAQLYVTINYQKSHQNEYCIAPTDNAVSGTTYYFKVKYNDGNNLYGYNNLPTLYYLPTAKTLTTSSVNAQSAVVNGLIAPDGMNTIAQFVYGTTSGVYTDTVNADQSPVGGNDVVAISKTLTGLNVGTTYYYAAAKQNDSGYFRGNELSFTTVTPVLSYSRTYFREAKSDSGAINNISTTITLTDETFTGNNGDDFVADGKIVVTNLPAGLTAVVTRTSATTLSISFIGQATTHTPASSVSNVTFSFQNSAFTLGYAAGITNSTKNDLTIEFIDAAVKNYLGFDGSDDKVSVPASPSINLSSQGTWEAWVYVSSLSHYHRVIFKEGSDGYGKYELYVLDGNFGADVVRGGNRYSVYANSTMPQVNTWYHLAATFDGTYLRIYLNGVLCNTATVGGSGAIDANTGPLGIGGNINGSPSSLLEGRLDEVRIWNVVRTQSEIAASMNSELNGNETGLVLYYDCNEASGTTLYDATNNGNNGTLLNGVTRHSGIPSAVTYSKTVFNEAAGDSGSINNSSPLIITYSGIGSFTGNNNDDFIADGKLVVSNLSQGLTAVATRTSSTTLSVTITGKANSHKKANNVSNLTFALQNSAFTNNNATTVLNSTKSDFQIKFVTVYNKNQFGTITFTKANYADPSLAANQDRLTDLVWITRNGSGGIYNRVTQTYGQPYDYHSPDGTEWAYGTTANYSSLTYTSWGSVFGGYSPSQLIGQNLVMHLIEDDIYVDVKFTWWQVSGGGGFSYERSRIGYLLDYSSSTFRESSLDNGTIDNSIPITITLVGDTLTGENGDNFVANGKLTVTNLPSGLTVVATKTSSTTLAVTIIGNATSNNQSDNISNLTLTFANSAFASGDASSVENSNKNDLRIIFFGGANNSLSFDGVNDYVHIPIAASPTAYTIEMWVKPADTTDAEIFVRTDGSGPNYAFSHQLNIRNRKFEHYTYDGSSFTVTGTTLIDANTWYHIAITAQNNDVIRLYVNGVEEGTPHALGTMWTGGDRYLLGSYGASLPNFAGLVDDVRIWNTVRTQTQISENKDAELRGTESGLLAYWNCNEGSGTILNDYTSNNFNSTLGNGTGWSSNSPITPLPVELVSFVATAKRLNVELQWKTVTETNNAGFEIQRSVISRQLPDNSNQLSEKIWSTVGFVEGGGTTNSPKNYSFTDKNLSADLFAGASAKVEKYLYRLKQIDRDGKFSYSQTVEVAIGSAPKEFLLEQNYPNPFNPTTTISYQLLVNSYVTLKIYDAIGKEVATLVNEAKEAGSYEIQFSANNLTSGVYFYRIHAKPIERTANKSFVQMKKLMLLK